ncbi:hypothetical protein [Nonomuraea sp. GTA35]|uniref:hypothetical protein n=1 Tax=Nonomuraea sp. GTA35 TaxID=1676746 RepID=UPI0035BF36FD
MPDDLHTPADCIRRAAHEDVHSLVLDFTGVEAITNGCADEMIADLIAQQDDRRIFVTGANRDVWDAITTACERRRLAALPEETTIDGPDHG